MNEYIVAQFFTHW